VKALAEQDHYEILEVTRDADPAEIERAYRMAQAAYANDSLALYSVFGDADGETLRHRIELAFQVLSDAERRRAYDFALDGDGAAPAPAPLAFELDREPAAREPIAAPHLALEAFEDLEPEEHGPDFDGSRLRRARLRRGIELDQIASVTKINPTYLRFLEEERFDDLPAPVYVRGFVGAYARCVGLDLRAVVPSYMARFDAGRSARKRGRSHGHP
jgi:flagellar biosynthesis protein FlhG